METLVKIQNELKVPKGNLNKFGNYKYRSAEDILEAVKPILLKHKVTLMLSDEMVLVGNKIFCKATARIMFDKDERDFETFGYAETSEHKGMSAEQTTGTASSYARKYALNGLFLIDETESDADSQKPTDNNTATIQVQVKQEQPKVTEWLTEEQFNTTMKSDKKAILAVLSLYNGQKGKGMKSDYLTKLTAQLSLAK